MYIHTAVCWSTHLYPRVWGEGGAGVEIYWKLFHGRKTLRSSVLGICFFFYEDFFISFGGTCTAAARQRHAPNGTARCLVVAVVVPGSGCAGCAPRTHTLSTLSLQSSSLLSCSATCSAGFDHTAWVSGVHDDQVIM